MTTRTKAFAATLLPLALTAGSLAAAAQPASAASAVQILKVKYDSTGSDNGTNASLNDEWVMLKNTASTSRVLTGWTVKDKTGYTYTFPTFTLKAGATVTVRTGKGTATSSQRYYNRTWYVWNNTGDTAYVHNKAGTLQDSCTWSAVGSGSKTC